MLVFFWLLDFDLDIYNIKTKTIAFLSDVKVQLKRCVNFIFRLMNALFRRMMNKGRFGNINRPYFIGYLQ